MLFQSKPTSWHSEFINYISKHNYIILMHSRKRWMEYKEENRIMNLETYRITCLSEAITPISHMMGVSRMRL